MGSFPTYSDGEMTEGARIKVFLPHKREGRSRDGSTWSPGVWLLKTPLAMSTKPLIYTFCARLLSFHSADLENRSVVGN